MLELSDYVDVGGKSAVIGTIMLTIYNVAAKHLSLESINPWILSITSLVALCYMASRWRGQYLKNEGQKLLNEQAKMEIEEKKSEIEVLKNFNRRKK